MKLTRLRAVIYAGFVLTGMVTTLLGPVLPALAFRWSLDDSHAGYLFTAQFLGSTTGVILSSLIVPRFGFTLSLALSYVLLALGVGAMGAGPWLLGLAAATTFGFGLGVIIPATNLWVSQTSGATPAAALNVVNLAWGIGAVSLPAVVAIAVRANLLGSFFLAIAGASLIVAIALFSVARGEAILDSPPIYIDTPTLWGVRISLAILFYLYVGAENGIAGWVAMHTDRLHVAAGTTWAATPSVFWGVLLIGRGLAVPVLRRVSEARLLAAGLLMAAIGVILLIGASSLASVVIGIGVAGLGLSSVFPLLVAKVFHSFGEAGPYVAGPIFAFGGLGGATVPWLVGVASQRGGGLRTGLAVPLAAVMLMGLVLMIAARMERHEAPNAARPRASV
jgi:MFS transporter, FHS family, glucose/mannose:H+ symporter